MPNPSDVALLSSLLPFWDTLSAPETRALLAGTKSVAYARGESVHSPSHACVGVLLVKTGELRTYILSENGKEVTLFRLNAGETCILSASCLLSNITFDVFIEAQMATEALLIDAATFAKLQDGNLSVENFALRIAADRFSDVMWAMEQILFMRFDARLAVFLLDETAKAGGDELALTHEQIAKYIGSAREVVSRMLKYFAREGIVSLSRGGVTITDRAALRKLTRAHNG